MDSKPVYIYPNSLTEVSKVYEAKLDNAVDRILKKLSQEKEEEEQLLTVEETLKFLKCSKQALWNWRKNGILPSYRLGNRVYYKKSDIFNKLIKQE